MVRVLSGHEANMGLGGTLQYSCVAEKTEKAKMFSQSQVP